MRVEEEVPAIHAIKTSEESCHGQRQRRLRGPDAATKSYPTIGLEREAARENRIGVNASEHRTTKIWGSRLNSLRSIADVSTAQIVVRVLNTGTRKRRRRFLRDAALFNETTADRLDLDLLHRFSEATHYTCD